VIKNEKLAQISVLEVLGKQGICMGGNFLNLILKLLYNTEDYRD